MPNNLVARITAKSVSGMTYKVQFFKIGNEHDLALDVIPVLHLDVIP